VNRSILKLVGYVGAGGALGFAYYYFIGCASGACPISSNPYISTLYGAFVGFLGGGGLKSLKRAATPSKSFPKEE
jgi:hypothetical protein